MSIPTIQAYSDALHNLENQNVRLFRSMHTAIDNNSVLEV